MIKFNNLIEVIQSKENKQDKGITFIRGVNEEKYITYGELYCNVTEMLRKLRNCGVKEKDEVVLQLSDDFEFITVFWACILGKMVPVPLPTNNNTENNNKVSRVLYNLKLPILVSDSIRIEELKQYYEKYIPENGCIFVNINTGMEYYKENECTGIMEDVKQHVFECKDTDTAFIQFSSGSTGQPKGVIITHKNIISNVDGIIKSSNINNTDILLSWVPLTYNLGLIVSHLLSMICHLDSYIMSTELFLYHPNLWMEKASQYKVTLTCSPNSGYKHYLNSLKHNEPKDMDLSNLRLIINGGEPISKKICMQFTETMKSYGLYENIFQMAYGLAEATVSVTSSVPGEELNVITIDGNKQSIGEKVIYLDKVNESTYGLELIGVGYTHYNNEIRVVDNNNIDLGEDVFGYIQVKGPITAKGYYYAKNETDNLTSKGEWLNTGDIGFMKGKQLVVCGRKKDIIFINGMNFYAKDLEKKLSKYDDTKEYLVIGAYNSKISRDQIIVFVKKENKTYEEFAELSLNLKRYAVSKCGIQIDYVLPVESIPGTECGKLQRYKIIDIYEKGIFDDTIKKIEALEKIITFNNSVITPRLSKMKDDNEQVGNNTLGLLRNQE